MIAPTKDWERSRRERSFQKCRCGNVAGLGQTLCSRCRDVDAKRAEISDDNRALEQYTNMLAYSGTVSQETLSNILKEVIRVLLKTRRGS